MARNLDQSAVAPSILLTPIDASESAEIKIPISELMGYTEGLGFTRLSLTGQRTLEVRESAGHIDSLIRTAGESAAAGI